jgi:hypothetical protein
MEGQERPVRHGLVELRARRRAPLDEERLVPAGRYEPLPVGEIVEAEGSEPDAVRLRVRRVRDVSHGHARSTMRPPSRPLSSAS